MLSLKPMYKTWRVFDQPIGMFVYFFVRCENFALYHNKKLLRADPCCRSVIKEFVHVFSCAYIGSISSYGCSWEVWRALKKLELLSAAPRVVCYTAVFSVVTQCSSPLILLELFLRIFRALQTSRVHP